MAKQRRYREKTADLISVIDPLLLMFECLQCCLALTLSIWPLRTSQTLEAILPGGSGSRPGGGRLQEGTSFGVF